MPNANRYPRPVRNGRAFSKECMTICDRSLIADHQDVAPAFGNGPEVFLHVADGWPAANVAVMRPHRNHLRVVDHAHPEEQYARIKDSLPVQRGNVSLTNLQVLRTQCCLR